MDRSSQPCPTPRQRVCRELLEQLREDPPVAGSPMTLSQKELYQAVQAAVETTRRRVTEGGETNGKGYIFFSCGLAQIDALAAGGLVDGTLEDVAREKLLEWQAILKTFAESRGLVGGVTEMSILIVRGSYRPALKQAMLPSASALVPTG